MALFDFASWLRQMFPRSHRQAQKSVRRKKTQALILERLEDRTTPAALYAANPTSYTDPAHPGNPQTGDTVTWNPGPGTSFSGPVSGLTYGTNAFGTIQAAVNTASPGDTIDVASGTYTEEVSISTANLTVDGAQFGVNAQSGRPGADESIVDGAVNGNNRTTSFYIAASNVTLDGFTVEYQNDPNLFGAGIVMASNTAGVDILNNIVTKNAIGIYADSNGASLIQHNLITGNNTMTDGNGNPEPSGGAGIYSDSTSHLTIDSNTFTNQTQNNPIIFAASNAVDHTNLAVTNNTFNNTYGIYALSISGGLFQGNTIRATDPTNGFALTFGGSDTNIQVLNNDLSNNVGGLDVEDDGYLGNLEPAPNSDITAHLNSFANDSQFGVGIIDPTGNPPGSGPNGYSGTLDVSCNWWGDISGPTTSSNSGGMGSPIQNDFAGSDSITYRTWLIYGDADPAAPGFQLPTTIDVTEGGDISAADNDYTRLANAIGCVQNGQTLVLSGTFDWTKPFAAAAWAKGNDGVAGTADDYTIYAPANVNNVTITANSLGAATIQGPGSIQNLYLEGPLQLNTGNNADRDYGSSTNQNWTISNLNIFDFALGIAMFDNPGGNGAAFSGTHIVNNHIRLASDVLDTVTPANTIQNIGIYYSFGQNQVIQDNTIDLQGNGVSDSANGNFSKEVGMQGDTRGGNTYDGLLIDSNTVNVLHAQSSDPEKVRGIWDNTDGTDSNVTVSNNKFLNLDAGNDPSLNRQIAFQLTSPSSATTTVEYLDNQASGANVGFQYYPGYDNTGTPPVQLIGNTLTNVYNGFDFSNAITVNYLSGNSVTGTGSAGTGIAVGTGSTLTTDGLSDANVISGFATGVDVNGGTAGLQQNTISGNGTGVSVENNGTLTAVAQNFITGNTGDGIRIASTAGTISAVTDNNLSGNGGKAIDNASSVLVNASLNWWGGATSAFVRAAISGKVDYTPFLVSGTDTDLVTPGFQGDFSVLDVDTLSPQSITTGRIQEGVNDVTPGGTVNVLAGTYDEIVLITKDLTLAGVSGNPTDVVITPPTGDGITISSAATNVTIKDLKVTGATNGVNATGVTGGTVTLQDLELESDTTGFAASGETTLNLTDLILTGNGAGGTISNVNTVNETPSSGSTPTNVTVSGSSFVSDLNQAISLSNILNFIVNGGSGSDTFNVTPSNTTTFTIHGNLPTPPASPGDTLAVPSGGALSDAYNPNTGYSGSWTFTGDKAINFDGIETLKSGSTTAHVPIYAAADFSGHGVYRFVDTGATSGWTSLQTSDASQVAVDANGDIVAVFDSAHVSAAYVGVYLYEDSTGWVQLSHSVPTAVGIVSPGYIVATFPTSLGAAGEGVWRYENGSWDHLNVQDQYSTAVSVPAAIQGANASLVGIDGAGNVVGEFSNEGVWSFVSSSNSWEQLTAAQNNASALQLAANGILAAEFPGQGVWEITPTTGWRQIETQDVSLLSVNANNVLAVVFQNPAMPGIYRFAAPTAPATNPTNPQNLNNSDTHEAAVRIAADNSVFAAFTDTPGLYYFNDTTDQWSQIFPANVSATTPVNAFFAD